MLAVVEQGDDASVQALQAAAVVLEGNVKRKERRFNGEVLRVLMCGS